jgi:antirestriction protein ArdC
VLKADPRAIFTAASKAQRAADWMHAQQPVSLNGVRLHLPSPTRRM